MVLLSQQYYVPILESRFSEVVHLVDLACFHQHRSSFEKLFEDELDKRNSSMDFRSQRFL